MRLVREEFGDEPEEMPTHGSAQVVDGADDSSDEEYVQLVLVLCWLLLVLSLARPLLWL
jgi:hypothetical protein